MGDSIRENLSDSGDSAAGALIGTFVGDALGMPVEGWSHERIQQKLGEVDSMIDARKGAGTYTDDTQMMIATAKSLLECGGVDAEHMAETFLEHHDPSRGYGRGTTRVFEKWRNGVDVESAADQIYEGGSFGNGGSMRIAPVGILYAGQPTDLEQAIDVACGLTHAHPLGLGSSYLQAFLVGEAYRRDQPDDLRTDALITDALENLPDRWDQDDLLSEKMSTVKRFLRDNEDPVEAGTVARELGCTSKAFESVPAALYAALANKASFESAVVYSVGIGGDTDTIGAMAGAVAGALHGVNALPRDWWDTLENGPSGRDEVVRLGRKLDQLRSP